MIGKKTLSGEKTEKIVAFMQSYNAHFDELTAFLSEKYRRVTEDDLCWLLDSLVTEQKLVMRGNSIEAKRLSMLEQMGLKDATFNRLIELSPEEMAGKMRVECVRMQGSVDKIKELNKSIVGLVEKKLSEQEKAANIAPAESSTYTVTGTKVTSRSGGFFGSV